MKIGNKLEDYVASKEPVNRSAQLLLESARRLKIPDSAIGEVIRPYTVYIQRLPVEIVGVVVNIMSGIVLHNRARGPYKGGIRIAPDVTLWETTELARLMTLKTALANIELGGGKSGISVNLRSLYQYMVKRRRFADGFRQFEQVAKGDIISEFTDHFGWLFRQHIYIPAPDMGTGGAEMVRIYNETRDPASVTGKPEGIEGWLPGRKEATGYGVYYAILKDMQEKGRAPDQCTVAVQGFGKVGSHVAQFLFEAGAKVIAITDLSGGVYHPDGLDIPSIQARSAAKGRVCGPKTRPITNEQLFKLKVDYLVPAARGHVITHKNAKTIRAKVVVEAANMPVSYEAAQILEQRGIEIIPDIYANAGGVIASNIEYRQALGGPKFTLDMTLAHIRERFDDMHAHIKSLMKRRRSLLQASTDIALQRTYQTMLQRSLL